MAAWGGMMGLIERFLRFDFGKSKAQDLSDDAHDKSRDEEEESEHFQKAHWDAVICGGDSEREKSTLDKEMWSQIARGNIDQAKKMLAEGASPNEALLSAILNHNDLSFIQYLVSKGAEINKKNGFAGQTPLMVAMSSRKTAAVLTLIDLGANVSDVDHSGRTVLHWGLDKNSTSEKFVEGDLRKLFERLLSSGANPFMRSAVEKSALEMAAQYNNIDAFEMIVLHSKFKVPKELGSYFHYLWAFPDKVNWLFEHCDEKEMLVRDRRSRRASWACRYKVNKMNAKTRLVSISTQGLYADLFAREERLLIKKVVSNPSEASNESEDKEKGKKRKSRSL